MGGDGGSLFLSKSSCCLSTWFQVAKINELDEMRSCIIDFWQRPAHRCRSKEITLGGIWWPGSSWNKIFLLLCTDFSAELGINHFISPWMNWFRIQVWYWWIGPLKECYEIDKAFELHIKCIHDCTLKSLSSYEKRIVVYGCFCKGRGNRGQRSQISSTYF